MTGEAVSPIRWKSRSMHGQESLYACGWVILSADSEFELAKLIVGDSGLGQDLRLRQSGIGAHRCITRLPGAGASISLSPKHDLDESTGAIRVIEIGWLQAYSMLFWQTIRQIFEARGALRTFRTALGLLLGLQFKEIRRRLVRRGGGRDNAEDVATFVPTSLRTVKRRKATGGPIRVVMCGHSLARDGAPISQLEFTVRLVRGNVIDPVVVSPSDGPLRAAYEAEGVTVVIQPSGIENALTERDYDRAVTEYSTFLNAFSPDLIYANTSQTFYAVDAANRVQLPCVWNIRESEKKQARFESYSIEIQGRAFACMALADEMVFVSEATRDVWQPFPEGTGSTVVHNSLDPDRLREAEKSWTREAARQSLDLAPQEVSVICVGTVCERKGQRDIVRAFKRMPAALTQQLRIDFIGAHDNQYARDMAGEIAGLPSELGKRLRVSGATHDVARHYWGADIFICASRLESYPRVILEAMARGIAIISTPVFGISEQLCDGETGLFYSPGDTVALAEHLSGLIQNTKVRERLGERARVVFDQRNDFEAMTERYAEIFRDVCSPEPEA